MSSAASHVRMVLGRDRVRGRETTGCYSLRNMYQYVLPGFTLRNHHFITEPPPGPIPGGGWRQGGSRRGRLPFRTRQAR